MGAFQNNLVMIMKEETKLSLNVHIIVKYLTLKLKIK